MSKHILDGARDRAASAKLVHYTRIDSDQMPRPQSKALHTKPHDTGSKARIQRFLDIDRRQES